MKGSNNGSQPRTSTSGRLPSPFSRRSLPDRRLDRSENADAQEDQEPQTLFADHMMTEFVSPILVTRSFKL